MSEECVVQLKNGRFSVPCEGCGRRYTSRYSADHIHCLSCRRECGSRGHEPDDDDETTCFSCGQHGLPRTLPSAKQCLSNEELDHVIIALDAGASPFEDEADGGILLAQRMAAELKVLRKAAREKKS